MGCDIHMRCEKRNIETNQWEDAGKIFPNPYYTEGVENRIDEEDGYEWNPTHRQEPYSGRNYDLFAILADVRNGRGFAGIKTGEGFNPIAEPKGLPDDVSDPVLKYYCLEVDEDHSLETCQKWVDRGISTWIKYGELVTHPDWHSTSWFTLNELLNYDWGQLTMKEGMVTLDEYAEMNKRESNFPDSYCGSVYGDKVVIITEKQADKYLEKGAPKKYKDKTIYIEYKWMATYDQVDPYFMETTIPNLKKLSDNYDDVRIVFWFDN